MAVPSEYYPTGTFQEWATAVSPFVAVCNEIPVSDLDWINWVSPIRYFSNFGSSGALVNDEIPAANGAQTWQSWADAVIAKMNEVYP